MGISHPPRITSITRDLRPTTRPRHPECPSRPGCRIWAFTRSRSRHPRSARSCSSTRVSTWSTVSITPKRSAPLPKRPGSIPRARWPTGGRRWCSARTSTRRWMRTTNRRRCALAQKALALKAGATPREQALYRGARHALHRESRRTGRRADRAFADAMSELVDSYPDDLDARTHLRRSR